nr:glycosyltransferase [uncultured Roseococcus sp.]
MENLEVSILIVNVDAHATARCLREISASTGDVVHEILIADIAWQPLTAEAPNIEVIRLGPRRQSGEANNILAERARSPLLCLLNPNVSLRSEWLRQLCLALSVTPGAGIVGPILVSEDKLVVAAGHALDTEGHLVPLRRGEATGSVPPQPARVDHLCDAVRLMPRQLFLDAGGFDLAFEPGSHEDADLSFRIAAMEAGIWCCPDLALSRTESADDRLPSSDIGHQKFARRWAHALRGPAQPPPPRRRRALIFSPYDLTPGGGERYILTLAAALSRDHDVAFAGLAPYSRLRLRTMGSRLGLDLSGIVPIDLEAVAALPPFDLMVAMGNEMLPPIAARARRNLFMCQFPFPLPPEVTPVASAYAGYGGVMVNSGYSRHHLRAALRTAALDEPPIRIVSPPVPRMPGRASRKLPMILSVGRFFVSGHAKRHDLLIDAFRELHRRHDGAISLHLAGSLVPGAEPREYLAFLQAKAAGLPVEFHVDSPAETMRELYRDAALYWHGTGLGVDLQSHPERAEHFGITIVEAMSAQCVALALKAGGAPEIITEGENGFLYEDAASLVETSLRLLKPDRQEERIRIGEAASRRAEEFSEEVFCEQIRLIAEDPSRLSRGGTVWDAAS